MGLVGVKRINDAISAILDLSTQYEETEEFNNDLLKRSAELNQRHMEMLDKIIALQGLLRQAWPWVKKCRPDCSTSMNRKFDKWFEDVQRLTIGDES